MKTTYSHCGFKNPNHLSTERGFFCHWCTGQNSFCIPVDRVGEETTLLLEGAGGTDAGDGCTPCFSWLLYFLVWKNTLRKSKRAGCTWQDKNRCRFFICDVCSPFLSGFAVCSRDASLSWALATLLAWEAMAQTPGCTRAPSFRKIATGQGEAFFQHYF